MLRINGPRVVVVAMVSAALGSAALAAHEPAPDSPASEAVGGLEPAAAAAFDRALALYPETIRERIGEVELRRERNYGVPADAPLMARLMGDAVYAYFSMNSDAITLLDAGLVERAGWTGDDASEAEVAGLMLDLGFMGEGGDPSEAWDRFVAVVRGWPGETPLDGNIRFGDKRVLDRFVRLGVGRALARDWEENGSLNLEQQMVHELAHALQLKGPLMAASGRMEAWGTLSGWKRVDTGEAFDGFHGGIIMLENPAVLGRLLVRDQRGEGLYEHAPGARFVNRYARYDAREDYAESVRLFIEDPDRLIRIDPTKFMFINALGYNATLSLSQPGPLWIGEAEIEELGYRDLVQRGARELLGEREGIKVDPRTVAGLLRAHAVVLRAADLPECDVFREAPTDAPDAIRRALDPEHFSVEIDGRRFGPDAAVVRRLLADAVTDWYDDDAFWREMDGLIEPSPETLEEEFAELAEIDDPQARAMSASRLFSKFGVLSDRRAAEMMAREVRAMRDLDRHVLAELLKLRYALGTRSSVSADLVGSWANAVTMDGAGYDTIELGRGLVDLLLREGEIDRAIDVAQSLKGDLWGQIRRADALCAIARSTGDTALLDAAAASAADRTPSETTKYVLGMVQAARQAIADAEESDE